MNYSQEGKQLFTYPVILSKYRRILMGQVTVSQRQAFIGPPVQVKNLFKS